MANLLNPTNDPAFNPFNMWVMDVDAFIKENDVGQVSSLSIHSPSSVSFHPEGLFSEEIFGQTATPERLLRMGYIELNAEFINPIIYRNILALSSLYEDILMGKAYATFDRIGRQFVRVAGDPELVDDADTGYAFFMKHLPDIEFSRTASLTRDDRIALIEKYRDRMIIRRMLVLPAGLRDIEVEGGRMSQDDINPMYTALMSLSFSIPTNTTNPRYNHVRMDLQRQLLAIYEHLENIQSGKHGFLQGKVGSRKIVGGTRNVITAADHACLTPDDPQSLKPDETYVGIFQTAKGLAPLMTFYLKSVFITPIFGDGSAQAYPLIDPDSFELSYQPVSSRELLRWTGPDAVEGWLNRYRNVDVRNAPVTVTTDGGKAFYLCLVYDQGKKISLFRSIQDLEAMLGSPPDRERIRPLTWVELMYMLTYAASQGRHVFITRYPVIQDASCYPNRIHLLSTTPGRVVTMHNLLTGMDEHEYPQYPILGNDHHDSIALGASRLAGLGGDHDGDMVSANYTMLDQTNRQVSEYLGHVRSYINTQRQFVSGGGTALVKWVFFNMTKPGKAA